MALVASAVLLACFPWLLLAAFAFHTGNYTWDGECYSGSLVWSLGEATVALAGIVVSVSASVSALAWAIKPLSGTVRPVASWLGVSITLMAGWAIGGGALYSSTQALDGSLCS